MLESLLCMSTKCWMAFVQCGIHRMIHQGRELADLIRSVIGFKGSSQKICGRRGADLIGAAGQVQRNLQHHKLQQTKALPAVAKQRWLVAGASYVL